MEVDDSSAWDLGRLFMLFQGRDSNDHENTRVGCSKVHGYLHACMYGSMQNFPQPENELEKTAVHA